MDLFPRDILTLHLLPGRVRLGIAALRHRPELSSELEAWLSEEPGIRCVRANNVTGSVVVDFEPGLEQERIHRSIKAFLRGGKAPKRSRSRVLASAAAPAQSKSRPLRNGARKKPAALPRWSPPANDQPWHAREAVEILQAFASDPITGLSAEEAKARLRNFGRNTLQRSRARSEVAIFASQFASLPIGLLGASAVVSAATGGIADAVVTGAVALMNGVIGYMTEWQAERTLRNFAAPKSHKVCVIRDGAPALVDTDEVVPGDVLSFTPGDYVAADGRVFASHNLTIDEAVLTGESVPVLKFEQALPEPDLPLAERRNMVFMGTSVSGGSGQAVTIATGQKTELGHIQSLAGEAERPPTPVERELDALGKQLVLLAGGICAVMFGIGILRGYSRLSMLKNVVALAVAAVPEGLPTVATTTLALGLKQMEKKDVLIRRLDAVEALGSLQTVCFDKTGTLTANSMQVEAVILPSAQIRGETLRPEEGAQPRPSVDLSALLRVGVLCSEAHIVHDGNGHDHLTGSATEAALLQLAQEHGFDIDAMRQEYPCLDTAYRDGTRKRMTTVHVLPGEGERFVAVKGSPEEVLSLCDTALVHGDIAPLDPELRTQILEANDQLAAEGLRVLGFASRHAYEGDGPEEEHLTWHGLAGLADPVREGVSEVLSRFHQAGIRTIMITGDQAGTAASVARSLGLSRSGIVRVATASDIETLSDAALSDLATKASVFARVSPAHKLKIVQALQRAGLVVAMTGDGVNDGPALKAADIGIAMGRSGTDVAKDIANVVLRNDNLETLISGIAQGRSIYGNIRKALRFLLATNLSEILVTLGEALHGQNELETPLELLWINLVTDILPGLGLAMLPPDEDVLARPPRPSNAPILSWQDFRQIGAEAGVIGASVLGAHLYALGRYGVGPRMRAVTFSSLVFAQLAYTYACRHELGAPARLSAMFESRPLNLAVAASAGLQALPLFVPGVQRLLGISALSAADIPIVTAAGLAPFLLAEFFRTSRASGLQPERQG